MDVLWQEIRLGLRLILARQLYAAAVVLILALGIGANAAVFSVVNAVLLRQLPFRNAGRVVWITAQRPERDDAPFSLPDFFDYRDHTASLDRLSAVANWNANLTGRGDAERLQGVRVSADLFESLGVDATLGRTLEPDDDKPGSAHVVVITHALWQRRFGADQNLVGQSLNLNGASYTVAGVLPPSFFFPIRDAELAVPLVPDADPWRLDRNTVNFLRLVGRLRPGATLEQSQAEMNALARKLREEFPAPNAKKMGVKLVPLAERVTGDYRRALWVLLGAVGFVLLIACANLANLNLSRAASRQREMAVRAALGATRWNLARQLFVENMLLASAGGVMGVVLARWGVRLLVAMSPASIPRAGEIGLDLWVLAFTAVLSLLAALVTGLAPALSVSRPDLVGQLKEGGRGSTERGRRIVRNTLVVTEVALSVVLLTGAGLLLKSFSRVESVEPGFDPQHVLAVRLSLPQARYPHLSDVMRFYDALLPRVKALPGALTPGVVNVLPMSGGVASVDFTVVGREFAKKDVPEAQFRMINLEYLRAMRIPLRAGREFTESDREGKPLVCLINETLARRYWPEGGAVGARVKFDDNDVGPREAEVVGIIGNVKQDSLEAPPGFDIYIPVRQAHDHAVVWLRNNQYWVVRTPGDPLAMANAFREQVRSVDADVAASNVRSLEQYLAVSMAPRRFNLQLLAIFSVAALLLALAGIYAVVSYSVSCRAHELGVRISLGAQRNDVLRLVMGEGLKLVAAGLGIGLLGALALTRAITSMLFSVRAGDPGTLLGVAALLLAAALAALFLPARRATRVDPLTVLRAE